METTPNKPVRYSSYLYNKFQRDISFDIIIDLGRTLKPSNIGTPNFNTPTRLHQGYIGPSNQHCHHQITFKLRSIAYIHGLLDEVCITWFIACIIV
ncbi:hypothetical protein PSTT_14966 [Puccinia striiformis]|uniref:Uncharacterized protein n=1 Tax=Puccinia striiformis TaxID=27350 RepID=A0A2S4UJW1_9BASI|nr:hypothetical protein PSTT_14966 [Puccinia striiformis]